MQEIVFTHALTPEAYVGLRKKVGWSELTPGQAKRGLEHTTFLVSVKHNGDFVGMGRVLFDFGYTAYIGDIIVAPEYQGKGIGKEIVSRLMGKVMDAAEKGDNILFVLVAAKGKEKFYEKLGFHARPSDAEGPGMCTHITK